MWATMDRDRSGEVDYKEFVEALARNNSWTERGR